MGDIDQKSNDDVHKITVKQEPQEVCTESVEKVPKLDWKSSNSEVDADPNTSIEGYKNGVSLTENSDNDNFQGTANTTPPEQEVVNNDASQLMDFCTNIRVAVDTNLGDAILSDTSDISDDTEYTNAEEIAKSGAPLPCVKIGSNRIKPKTPGAKWTRHTYVRSLDGSRIPTNEWQGQYLGEIEPGKRTLAAPKPKKSSTKGNSNENVTNSPTICSSSLAPSVAIPLAISKRPEEQSPSSPSKFKKILPKPTDTSATCTTTTSTSPKPMPILTGMLSATGPLMSKTQITSAHSSTMDTVVIRHDDLSTKDCDKNELPAAGKQLAEFCTNINISKQSGIQSTLQSQTNSTMISNAATSTQTIKQTPVLITKSTRNLAGLPRPPNKFQYHWMNVYHWLEYDTTKHAMFCSMCKKLQKMNPFASERGCTNFKTCTLKRHEESKEHLESAYQSYYQNQGMPITGQPHTLCINPALRSQTSVPSNAMATRVIAPSSSPVSVVSQSQIEGLSSTNVKQALTSKLKRNAQGQFVSLGRPPNINDFIRKVDRTKTGMNNNFKILPQTTTTGNATDAPVMVHNYNGFRVAYFLAKEQLPISSAENVIALVDYPPFYKWKESLREQIFNDIINCIAVTIHGEICLQLSQAKTVVIILEDGGEETSSGCHYLLVHVRYIHEMMISKSLLYVDLLHDMSPDGIISLLSEILLKYRIPYHKINGLEIGSDKDGIITHCLPQIINKLSRQGCQIVSVHTSGNPHLTHAVSSISRRLAALQRYESYIGMIFDYYDSARNHTVEIPLIQEHLDEQIEEVLDLCNSPWLSRSGTVRVIFLAWSALVEALQAEEDEETKDLLNIITQYTFVALTHFFMDFLPIIQTLQQTIESKHQSSGVIESAAELTIASVEALQDNLGVHERQFFEQFDQASGCFDSIQLLNHQVQQQETADIRNEFLRMFLIELRGRYPGGLNSKANVGFKVVDPKVLCDIQDKNDFGLPQISVIYQQLDLSLLNVNKEFQFMVDHAKKQFSKASVFDFCKGLLDNCASNVATIATTVMILPGIHEPPSEQISAVNHLETLRKLDLGKDCTEKIRNRLLIVENGPPVNKFDYEKAYLHWIDRHPDRVSEHDLEWKKRIWKRPPSWRSLYST